MSTEGQDYGSILSSSNDEAALVKPMTETIYIPGSTSHSRFRVLGVFLFCGFVALSLLAVLSLRTISVSYVQFLAAIPQIQQPPNGAVVYYPTMYPTGSAPTMYPTLAVMTGIVGIPTQYPTGAAPTQFPTIAAGSPTLFPTEIPPTLFPTPTTEKEHFTVAESSISFTTKRDGYEYLSFFGADAAPYMTYKVLDGYNGVVEPDSDMRFHIFDDDENDSLEYKFEICETETDNCAEYMSTDVFRYSCTGLRSNYSVTVEQYNTTTGSGTGVKSTGSLLCLYVRREFRTLTKSDLNKTMAAMWKMWELDEDEGIEFYGDHFHNYARLLEYHYFNAAWQDAGTQLPPLGQFLNFETRSISFI